MKRTLSRSIVVFLLVFATCVTLPALATAATYNPINANVVITLPTSSGTKSINVGGMTVAQATATLAQYKLKKTPAKLPVTVSGKSYTIATGDLALTPNISALVTQASQVATGTAVGSASYVTPAAQNILAARIAALAKKTNLKTTKQKTVAGGGTISNFGGRTINQAAALTSATELLNKYGRTIAEKPGTLKLSISPSRPKMSGRDGKGKVLVASLALRRVYLFNGNSLVANYGICIGMPGYSTPTGTYVVARKQRNPTWRNPGKSWSRGMAQSISGARGPLGKAALYLTKNGRDIGIRFHGTHKTWSIGQAQSHGCMRLANSDIVKLYAQVPVGTKVSVFK